jgi:proteasome lid subunit RPN8/RPN11
MLLIQKSVLASCLHAARAAFPNEFLGLLEGRRLEKGDEEVQAPPTSKPIKSGRPSIRAPSRPGDSKSESGDRSAIGQPGDLLITNLVVPPGLSVNNYSAHYDAWQLSPSINHWGTFHSHPNYSNRPSRQDVRAASKEGGLQLIACLPYTLESLQAYDSSGQKLEFKIV